MRTYLLDTSAILAHFLKEPGDSRVVTLMGDQSATVLVAAPTWFELAAKLQEKGCERQMRDHVVDSYREVCGETVHVDDSVVRLALRLRDAMTSRLPTIDALIAGCAMATAAVLVHKDGHMRAIPREILPTFHLGDDGDLGVLSGIRPVVREGKGVYETGRNRRRKKTSRTEQ